MAVRLRMEAAIDHEAVDQVKANVAEGKACAVNAERQTSACLASLDAVAVKDCRVNRGGSAMGTNPVDHHARLRQGPGPALTSVTSWCTTSRCKEIQTSEMKNEIL